MTMILEKNFWIFGCFGAFRANNFDEISDGINACQNVKCHFLFVDCHFPRADFIVNFPPQKKQSRARSWLSSGARRSANLRANLTVGDCMLMGVAKIWMTEMMSDESFKLVHTGGVCCDEMVPINKWMQHVSGNDNFP